MPAGGTVCRHEKGKNAMEHESKTNEDKTMKQKKTYIAPRIKIIPMEQHLMLEASTWDGGDGQGGHIIEDDPPIKKSGNSKDAPYSGDWEL